MNFKINNFCRAILAGLLPGAMVLVFSFGCSQADAPPPASSMTSLPPITIPTDDYGNQLASAVPATIGTPVAGKIETSDDADYFSVRVTEAGMLGATTTGDMDTFGAIYDSDGARLAYDDDAAKDNTNFDVSSLVTNAGAYYIRVSSRSGRTGEYSLTVTFTPSGPDVSVEIDDYGDDISSAVPFAPGMTILGNIETSDDEDYFSIQLTEAGILRASTTGTTDTAGAIYDSEGERLAYHDDIDGENKNFSVAYRVSSGIHYVGVVGLGTATGEYGLAITFMPDDHGNARAQATPVTNGTPVTGNIETGDDSDYFSIEAPVTGTLTVKTTGTTDTIGVLYHSTGVQLAINDDDGTGTNFSISHPVTGGTYYVKVISKGTSTGMYRLTIAVDDHGNDRDSATPITSGTKAAGNIETGDDQDYFSIEVTSTELSSIDVLVLTASTTGSTNTIGHLYDSDENELATDDDGGTDMNFSVSYRIVSAGTYYIRVTSSGTNTGMYSLTVTAIPADHGNTRATAFPVTSGTAITGNIRPDTDEDYFSIVVSGAGTLAASTTGSTDTIGTIYDSSGTQLVTNNDGGEGNNFSLSQSVTTTGTYYVKVSSESTNTGTYILTVTFTP